jgi:hypothetical protein
MSEGVSCAAPPQLSSHFNHTLRLRDCSAPSFETPSIVFILLCSVRVTFLSRSARYRAAAPLSIVGAFPRGCISGGGEAPRRRWRRPLQSSMRCGAMTSMRCSDSRRTRRSAPRRTRCVPAPAAETQFWILASTRRSRGRGALARLRARLRINRSCNFLFRTAKRGTSCGLHPLRGLHERAVPRFLARAPRVCSRPELCRKGAAATPASCSVFLVGLCTS